MLESFEDGRLSGCVGKIQNLSSSVGFITRTLEGRVDFKDNIYFRKETIEDNISSGIIDLRQTGLNHVTGFPPDFDVQIYSGIQTKSRFLLRI